MRRSDPETEKQCLHFFTPTSRSKCTPTGPDIGSEVYHGHEGFLDNFAELQDVFDDLVVDPQEIAERGDRIMVTTRMTGRGKGSGVAIEAKIFHVWTLRDGMASRLEIFSDEEQAREALAR
jgi:ketosteroid isomerase-like protein